MIDPLPYPRSPRKVKKLLSEDYDRNKPVIIIGKGPSARYIEASDEYYTCCLNTSGRFTNKINFQFLGDHQVYKQMCAVDGYFSKTENLIYPVQFNQDNPQRKKSKDLIDNKALGNLKQHEYTFHFHPYPETQDVRLYTVISTGELAIAWLLEEGFKTFYTVGIDPHAPDNVRHYSFEQNGEGVGQYPNNPGGMIVSYNRMMKRVNLYGAEMKEYQM